MGVYGAFVLLILGFSWLADEVIDKDTMPFDVAILQNIRTLKSPTMDQVVLFFTQLAGAYVIPVVLILLVVLFYFQKRRYYSVFVLLTLGGTFLLNTILKLVFQRARPDLFELLVVEKSYSFPSGHAMISMALAMTLAVIFFYSRQRYLVIVLGVLYVLGIGFTRMYLGVHYPSDILGGWIISAAWVLIVTRFMMKHTAFSIDTLTE